MSEERVICADIVACFDVSANMVNCLEDAKKIFMHLCERFEECIKQEYCTQQMHTRVKVIAFRSYGTDAEPMTETRFFNMDSWNDRAEMYKFIDSLEPKGGENGRSCSLEALARAFKSDWIERRGGRAYAVRRCITLLFTNAEATPLRAKMDAPGYPEDMPTDVSELRYCWDEMKTRWWERRIAIFAPDIEPWTDIDLCNAIVWHFSSEASKGLDDTGFECAIRMLANSDY